MNQEILDKASAAAFTGKPNAADWVDVVAASAVLQTIHGDTPSNIHAFLSGGPLRHEAEIGPPPEDLKHRLFFSYWVQLVQHLSDGLAFQSKPLNTKDDPT